MSTAAQAAFAPLQLGPLRLRNRFIKSATNEGMAPGGMPSRALLELHRRVAAGGVAMTTLAYCAVTQDGRTFPDQLMLDEAGAAALKPLVDAVHREGAAACAQLTHGGAFTFLPELAGGKPLSASGGLNPIGFPNLRPFKRAMTAHDLDEIAGAFVTAARNAQSAGFDAVELHMGHGYLLSQFLSPKYNRRKDQYGGSAASRARFPAQVLERVLDAVGHSLAVTCKISVIEGFRGGGRVEDAIEVARVLERSGAHMLVLSAGMNAESPWTIFGSPLPPQAAQAMKTFTMRMATRMMNLVQPKTPFRELYLLEHSRRVRAAVKLPLTYLGGVSTLDGVQHAMEEGFDCVAMARALLHTPDLVNRFRTGVQAGGCTACNRCVSMMYTPAGTRCVLVDPEGDVALNRP